MRLFKSTAPKLCQQFGALTIPNDLRRLTIRMDNIKGKPHMEETLWKIIAEFTLGSLQFEKIGETGVFDGFADIQSEIQQFEIAIRAKNPNALTQISKLKHLENPQFLATLTTLNEIAKGRMIKNLGKLAGIVSTDFIQSLQQFSDVIPQKIPGLLIELQKIDPTELFELLDQLHNALNEMESDTDVRPIHKKLHVKNSPEIKEYLAYQSLQDLGFHHTIEYPIARFYQAKLICDEERNKIRKYILVCLNTLRTRAESASPTHVF